MTAPSPVYRFRLRWMLEPGRSVKDFEGAALLALPDIGVCEIKPIAPPNHLGGQSLALIGPPTASREKAMHDAETVLGRLLQATLKLGYAVLLQPSRPQGVITPYGMEWLREQYPGIDTLYPDSLGIAIYEEKGETKFASMGALSPSVLTSFTSFVQVWDCQPPVKLSRRNLIAYELYASSRCELSSRARFLLLVMAVESLAMQEDRPADEQALIAKLVEQVKASGLTDPRRDALIGGLQMFRKISISESCRNLIAAAHAQGAIADRDAVGHFRKCYRLRSQIVHSGKTPSPEILSTESNQLEKTVRELIGWALLESAESSDLWPSEITRFMPG
ncbi:hypothetical protein Q8A64_01160 [Oxalobacteraceae bacterium R-40]|uniref:Apea-like HEPN domain-containing protein n=1 Tax=Keguizhuia sedimenti TaxID=3064264 RepID=A0ABU1BLH9_9BURK|nr:hypothetical protein [Oxalobacteraceae bacterium R-40]